jgi:hypothetical protein
MISKTILKRWKENDERKIWKDNLKENYQLHEGGPFEGD